jgi:hypothetical protein
MRLFERSERRTLYGVDYPYKLGTHIWHESLGPGLVIKVDGRFLIIRFENGETRHIVASFVVPRPTHPVSMTAH